MSDDLVTLTATLYDQRDPNRPRVFIAQIGQQVPKSLADRFGGEYSGAPVADKRRTPQAKPRTPRTKSS